MTKQKMKEVFEKAKSRFETCKWYQKGQIPDSNDCECAFTAILRYCPDPDEVSLFFTKVNKIPKMGYCFGIPAWNDSTERTKDDVLKAFDKAIEACGVEG